MLHESTCEWSRVPCPLAGDDDDPFLLYIYFPLHRWSAFIYIIYHIATAGCTARICRKDIDKHLAEAAKHHNLLFVKEITELRKETTKEITELRKETTKEITELKRVVMNATHEITLQVNVDELVGNKVMLMLIITQYSISHTLSTHHFNTPSNAAILYSSSDTLTTHFLHTLPLDKAIVPKNPAFPTRIYSTLTNICGYQVCPPRHK